MMINVKARIKLYSGDDKRKTPFLSGYRPLFEFLKSNKQSGMIILLDRDNFKPGEEGIVEIRFIEANFIKGESFYFYEGKTPLGEGVILKCTSSDLI